MSGRLPNGTWVALLVLWGGAFASAAANAPQWITGVVFGGGGETGGGSSMAMSAAGKINTRSPLIRSTASTESPAPPGADAKIR